MSFDKVQYMDDWRKRNPDKAREYNFKSKYGITTKEYDELYTGQSGCCALCSKHSTELSRPLCVDHDHETGKVRGLLCSTCNSGLGKLGDNEEGLLKALEYLRNAA